jgi:Fe-S cluster assembly protein SufD
MSVTVASDIREQAAQRFAQLGWPSTKLEEWKYTSVAPIARVEWRFDEQPKSSEPNVFVNGRGATNATAHPLFAKYADYMRHPFVALNTANAQDGALIVVPDGQVVEGPISLRFVGRGDGIWSHPRNLIVVGRNAHVTIVESYGGSGNYFTNAVTEIVAAEGAVIDHTRLQCESPDAFHVGTLQIHQERGSSVTARTIAFGSQLARLETNVALAGEGATLTLDGLFVLAGRQHVDNQTLIDHARPHCESIELYKGILDESARGIFDGRIIVRPDAVKTNSRQTNHNLLLSETAIVDSKPTLEIHNDDVKCSHGSTIGQLDEDAMFYLRARGIGESDARNLLVYAFASEIVDRIKVEAVREEVRRAMFAHMPQRLPERRGESR